MGSSTPPTSTQTTHTELSPQQQQIYNLAFPSAQQAAATPLQMFTGSGVAPINATEHTAAGQFIQAGTAGQGIADDSANALHSATASLSVPHTPGENPYLDSVAQNMRIRSNQNLTEQQLPAIASGATQAGGAYSGGSTREGIAQGLATGRTNQGLDASIADLMFKAYQQDTSNELQRNKLLIDTTQAAPGVQNQQLFQPGITSAVGGQERQQSQAELDDQIRRFYTGQELPMLRAQELMSLISGMPGASNVSEATGSVPHVNPLVAAGGGALSGAVAGSTFGPIGTGVGAAGGGLLGLLLNRR